MRWLEQIQEAERQLRELEELTEVGAERRLEELEEIAKESGECDEEDMDSIECRQLTLRLYKDGVEVVMPWWQL